nr:hypothetical protein [Opitutaceae bacterium]
RAYRLVDFQITSTGILTVGLESRATATGAFAPLAAARSVFDDGDQVGNPGVRLVTYSSSSTAPWSNVSAYNLAFTSPVDPSPDSARPFPAGSGYGLAPTRPDGRLNFKGKLADGSLFTASLLGAGDASFRLFLRPHGAAPGSVLSARLPLTIPRLDYPRHSIRGDDGLEAYWSKPALPKSANYRAGFGPLGLTVRLEPWFPRSFADFGFATTSNASRGRTLLSLDDTELGSSAGNLPDAVVVTFGNPIAFFADEASANPARFTGLLDTRSGFLRGDFRLTDTVAGRTVSRTVPFEGTFLMSENLVGGTVTAEGFALVPALPGATPATATSVRLRFRDPRTPPATP